MDILLVWCRAKWQGVLPRDAGGLLRSVSVTVTHHIARLSLHLDHGSESTTHTITDTHIHTQTQHIPRLHTYMLLQIQPDILTHTQEYQPKHTHTHTHKHTHTNTLRFTHVYMTRTHTRKHCVTVIHMHKVSQTHTQIYIYIFYKCVCVPLLAFTGFH